MAFKVRDLDLFKFIYFQTILALALVTIANAGFFPVHQEHHNFQPVVIKSEEHYDPHPHYQFSYAIHDPHTGDIKHQSKTRDGDVVKREYSLIDADCHKRIVHYSADKEHGFNAVVHREPIAHLVKAAHTAPVAHIASVVIKSAHLASSHVSYDEPTTYTNTYANDPASYANQGFVKSEQGSSYSGSAYSYHH